MNIGFVNFTPLVYNVDTPYGEPLGGSESALCYLAEALAKRGHQVTLFGRLPKIFTSRGVNHIPDTALKTQSGNGLDYLIIQNTPYFGKDLKSTLMSRTKLIFWTGHGHYQPAIEILKDKTMTSAYSAFVFVSHWQMESYLQAFPIDRSKCIILRNAVSPFFENLFKEDENILLHKSKPPVLAYTSVPYTGLELLLEIFPKIRAVFPDCTLKVFSSLQVYQHSSQSDAQDYGKLYDLCRHTTGVKYIGSLSQIRLAQELKNISILTYPNTIPETSSIAVMEAMASGCQIISSDFGGIPETAAGFASLVPLCDTKEEYIAKFVAETCNLLRQFTGHEPDLADRLQRQVTFTHACYTWTQRARQWENWLQSLAQKSIN